MEDLEIGSFSVPGSTHAYQDRLLIDSKRGLFAVADGVSIPDFGDSGKAAEFALAALEKSFSGDLANAIELANNELLKERKRLNLGLTTISAVHISGMRATFANVGDSLSFLLRDKRLIQMGQIDNNGFYITQVLGQPGITVHSKETVLRRSDIVILATDGVEHVLNEATLLRALANSLTMKEFASNILQEAKEHPSAYDDDKTLLCIRL
jgi:serine/threonine protein phosphatase PrpC